MVELDLTGKVFPWVGGGPVLLGMPGSPSHYLACFTYPMGLEQFLREADVIYDSIKQIEDGREFLDSIWQSIPSREGDSRPVLHARRQGPLHGDSAPMTPELLQLLRMVRDGHDPHAPVAPQDIRRKAAAHVDGAIARQLIRRLYIFQLTAKGKHLLEHEEAMLAARQGAPALDGAALALPGEAEHADLQVMADHLAGVCQAQVNAMSHGRINFTLVVHAGDPSQIPGAPAWAYAMGGNVSRREQIVLLAEQLRVLREQEALEQAAADRRTPFEKVMGWPAKPPDDKDEP